jgi:hypothetical protein
MSRNSLKIWILTKIPQESQQIQYVIFAAKLRRAKKIQTICRTASAGRRRDRPALIG